MQEQTSAIVQDGVVTGVILGSIPDSIPCGPEVQIGWLWDGETFSEQSDAFTIEEVRVEPPSQITTRQLILGLASDGWITWPEAEAWADRSQLPAAVNTVIDQMPEEKRPAVRITAKTMSVAERDNPLIIGAAKIAEPEKSDEAIAKIIAEAFTRWAEL